ncbi:hypothetical protein A1O3_07339 [Capronia epimyces CBS 606.96]|uniref:RNA helicase n=1 Tax=Capronia epimyces CBS 606.96 TaxID=1182542 RepID=W9XVM3_9EURO|nr:uncharacterized protein A1O3_07339 [Capronia epimyces CBS 606.96]EXJ81051.1 hypothetical protein A1O3_07339 [Capronia epimyces CBS 606.96]
MSEVSIEPASSSPDFLDVVAKLQGPVSSARLLHLKDTTSHNVELGGRSQRCEEAASAINGNAEDAANSQVDVEHSEQEAESAAYDALAPEEDSGVPGSCVAKRRKYFDVNLPASNLLDAIETIKLARQYGLTDDEVVSTPYAAESSRGWVRDILRSNQALAAKMKLALEKGRQKARMQKILAARHKLPLMSDTTRPKILELIKDCDVTIILSKTGSGKTTQIPQIILDDQVTHGFGPVTSILCTQPRRLAATSTARRVAYERGEALQDSVGYHIRNDKWPSRQQGSITYCTTGILLNRLIADEWSTLQSHSHIIIDEVHERNIQIDLVLAILRGALQSRKATGQRFPKIILMSATIDPTMFLEYFRQPTHTGVSLLAESLQVEGSAHHVETHYLPEILSELTQAGELHTTMHALLQGKASGISSAEYIRSEMRFATKQSVGLRPDSSGLSSQLAETGTLDSTVQAGDRRYIGLATSVIAHLADSKLGGDILVFLPGRADIDEIFNLLIDLRPLGVNFTNTNRFKLFKLHSNLRDSNDEVFKPVAPGCRRIILTTNIAETSVTLPEVVYVVDSGLLRSNTFDPLTRLRSLPYEWISKTSLIQRRGRAGRVRDGHYYALFTKERHDSFIAMRRPEIAVADLVTVVLQLKAYPQRVDVREFLRETIEPPPPQAIESALKDLKSLHALTESEEVTSLGRLLARFALHPAAAKGILLGALFGCLEPMLILAYHSSTDSLISHPEFTARQLSVMKQQHTSDYESDLVSIVEAFRDYHTAYRAGDADQMKDLRDRRLIRHHVYLDMMVASVAIHQILSDVGFLPGAEAGRSVFEILPASMNSNRNNMVLVKALAVNTITPELAAWREKGPLKKLWSLDDPTATGLISRDSVNEKATKKSARFARKYRSGGRLVAYSWKHDTPESSPKGIWLEQTSMVTPLMSVLFSRNVTLSSPQIVMINDWLRLKLNAEEGTPPVVAEQSARILMELRKTVDRFVGLAWEDLGLLDLSGEKSARGSIKVPSSGRGLLNAELQRVVVDSVVKMLNEDDAYWRSFRERRRAENIEAEAEAEAKRVEEMNQAKANEPVEDEAEEPTRPSGPGGQDRDAQPELHGMHVDETNYDNEPEAGKSEAAA